WLRRHWVEEGARHRRGFAGRDVARGHCIARRAGVSSTYSLLTCPTASLLIRPPGRRMVCGGTPVFAVKVSIDQLVSEDQCGFVECCLEDTAGRRWLFYQ